MQPLKTDDSARVALPHHLRSGAGPAPAPLTVHAATGDGASAERAPELRRRPVRLRRLHARLVLGAARVAELGAEPRQVVVPLRRLGRHQPVDRSSRSAQVDSAPHSSARLGSAPTHPAPESTVGAELLRQGIFDSWVDTFSYVGVIFITNSIKQTSFLAARAQKVQLHKAVHKSVPGGGPRSQFT